MRSLDVRMLEESSEFGPEGDVGGGDIEEGYIEGGERLEGRGGGAQVGVEEGGGEGVEV